MSASRARDRAAELAKADSVAALREARAIPDPWFRSQALAYVARFAAEKEIEGIVGEALDACRECGDAYRRLAAAAWPLCALVERGTFDRVRDSLASLLAEEADVHPASSRSEALFLLFQACFDLDAVTRESLVRKLVAAHAEARHWRSRRNLIDALTMLNARDRALAERIASEVGDERARRRLEASLRANVRTRPRPFFS
jgi:hypothetical protein